MTINKEQAVSDALPAPLRRVIHELRLSEQVFREYGHQHQDKAAESTEFKEAQSRQRKATRNYERADCCKAALDGLASLEQQQAVSGDMVERLVREFEKIQGYKGDEHRTMARAALTASGMGTWQPIETAPKDGAVRLVYIPNARSERKVYEARWNEEAQIFTSVNGFLQFGDATDWMPLPEPPRTALQEGVEE